MLNRLIISLFMLTLLISCDNESRQDNSTPIKVISKEKIRFAEDTTSGRPFPDFDFTSTRVTYSDSSFSESGLICSDDTANGCKLTFKTMNGFWYIKADNEWQEFYNPKDSLLKVVYFRKEKFILKPLGERLLYNKKELLGFLKEDLYVYTSHENVLFFHPDFGVVAIGRQPLVRADFKEKTK